ncbi:hypothetical protein DPMN_001817 [Dreissena polymorpha]|uniref:Uncharacterized protein n=1 Tax=Dreissena polymorpha TaxID=45954 RepID=A0A9D4RTE0_DREPO|nr:hypothetical protein DPMN_001817 [Dreissena polymorpha]
MDTMFVARAGRVTDQTHDDIVFEVRLERATDQTHDGHHLERVTDKTHDDIVFVATARVTDQTKGFELRGIQQDVAQPECLRRKTMVL